MITSRIPNTWQQLEFEVARILAECDFTVEIQKKLATVRGTVEVDVYAEETVKGRKYTILCECKHWGRRVRQDTIHAFSTVVNNFGANVGYIVSLHGFQSGAFQASNLTNLELVTWEEFQSRFEETWHETYFQPFVAQALFPLLRATLPLLSMQLDTLSEETRVAIRILKQQYEAFVALIEQCIPLHPIYFPQYSTTVSLPILHKRDGGAVGALTEVLDLPIIKTLKRNLAILESLTKHPDLPMIKRELGEPAILVESIPMDILQATGHREFCRSALRYAHEVIAHEVIQEIVQSTKDPKYHERKLEFACMDLYRFDANWVDDDYQ